MKKLIILILWLNIAIVTGCSSFPYKIDIQQGNIIEQDQLNRVQPGMTKNQVQYLLGTPLVDDPFHQNRWDYYYSLKTGGKLREQHRVTLFFENDQLARLEGDMRPQQQAAAPTDKSEVVDINPSGAKKKGFFGRMLEKVGIGG